MQGSDGGDRKQRERERECVWNKLRGCERVMNRIIVLAPLAHLVLLLEKRMTLRTMMTRRDRRVG